ncbi:hypothetical protein EVAR_86506_1 [Eumeta japonica]|uniref:Uncharacterized protein n=1 Tax=Eumeta variegata TaxID=151549 RepID=A0A4C1VP91_EUMVA|nr:hypothetical protein EVAR_86506_1 [Eumeta japonica]
MNDRGLGSGGAAVLSVARNSVETDRVACDVEASLILSMSGHGTISIPSVEEGVAPEQHQNPPQPSGCRHPLQRSKFKSQFGSPPRPPERPPDGKQPPKNKIITIWRKVSILIEKTDTPILNNLLDNIETTARSTTQ